MTETARLRIPLLAAAQAQKHVTVNEGWIVADTLIQASVLGFATTPAGGESDGDCYIVAATATDDFAGWEGRIARRQDGEWFSFLPGGDGGNGWIVWNQDDAQLYVCDGAGNWSPVLGDIVQGPGSVTDGAPVLFDGTSGAVLKETSFAAFKTALALAKADVGLGSVLNVPQREKLTANRTYYVRTDGSDGNDGLTNSAGGAFLTLQKAMDVVAALDLAIYTVTVSVAAGTYTGALILKTLTGAGTVQFIGDETTPSNVYINVAAGTAIYTAAQVYGTFVIAGFRIGSGTAGDVSITSPCRVTLRNNRYSGTANFRIYAAKGGYVSLAGTANQIAGGGFAMFGADQYGTIEDFGSTFTLVANVTYSLGFAFSRNLAFLLSTATYTLGAFSVTGPRYAISGNAILSVFGATLPGSTGGTIATGGILS